MIVTERETSLVYEAQVFEEFVIVRPVSPGFETVLEKLDTGEFYDRFNEFWGDPSLVYEHLGVEESKDDGLESEICTAR